MKPLPIKHQIKQHIKTLFNMLKPGDQLSTTDVVRYCKRMTGKQMYPDSAIKYMRDMRQDEEINYTCSNKCKRSISVLEIGEPHSL